MKGDYSKILKLAKYKPIILSLYTIHQKKSHERHLRKARSKHKGINALFDSLSLEAQEEIRPYMNKINEEFSSHLEYYKLKYGLK